MKKSQLHEAIRAIVRRKLKERYMGTATVSHGVDGHGHNKVIDAIAEIGVSDDKTVQRNGGQKTAKYAYFTDGTKKNVVLVGYGQMSYAVMKSKMVEDLAKMEQFAKQEKYDAILSQWNNITKYIVQGLVELDQTVTEAFDVAQTGQPTVQATTDLAGKPLSPAEQKKIADLEAVKSKAQNDLENTKSDLAKKTKPYTDKINKLEKRVGDTNTAIERIKK